jgi:hypothetical protein
MSGTETTTIILSLASIAVPVFLVVVTNGMKSTQSDMLNQLKAIEEKGTLRGQHLEDKIIDIKTSVGELKQDIAQRQLIDEGIKQQLLKELHDLSVEIRVIKKDMSITQDLYDKRIEHEGEVLDKLSAMDYDLKSLQKKFRNLENKQKEHKEILRQNGINETRD